MIGVMSLAARSRRQIDRPSSPGSIRSSTELDLEALHARRLQLFGVSNKLRNAEQRAVTVRGMVADVLPAIADGRITPVIDRVYAFDELPAAKEYMESNAHLGKIVVRMEDTAPV